jgi:hypothetical protein
MTWNAKALMGIKNSRPLRAYVEIEQDNEDDVGDWFTPAQARKFAARLITEAGKAENLAKEHAAKKASV